MLTIPPPRASSPGLAGNTPTGPPRGSNAAYRTMENTHAVSPTEIARRREGGLCAFCGGILRYCARADSSVPSLTCAAEGAARTNLWSCNALHDGTFAPDMNQQIKAEFKRLISRSVRCQ